MNRPLVFAKNFRSFADLAAAYDEGVDYRITRTLRPRSTVGIVAPHGGRIEAHTSEIAAAIAGADFSLYVLERTRSTGNYEALHLTSRAASNCWPPVTTSSQSTDVRSPGRRARGRTRQRT